MLIKEYRICMPLTVDEYKIGQLYMISKHSSEQSGGGEGVEVVRNEPCTDPTCGDGQVTEKRIYLNSKLPAWMRRFVPMAFYVTETAWNFYPYTITGQFKHSNTINAPAFEYSCALSHGMYIHLVLLILHSSQKCSFLPKFQVRIETRFENDNGSTENVFGDNPTPEDSVCFLDILSDPIPDKHYKQSEDLSNWVSKKTGRGPLVDGWRNTNKPIMCSYKKVTCSFEVYGFQGRTEEFVHRNIRDILLVGHRQAVAWTDEWHGMTLEEVREYERKLQDETNSKLKSDINCTDSAPPMRPTFTRSISVTDESSLKKMGVKTVDIEDSCPSSIKSPLRLNSTPE
ncbi:cytoplasmic phosphatidylinositol transfer protein 1-like [Myxocyprinus asiaticus]|uniref:cytoplasmic phosphatidylinositol transfer protein 1-like n=1 Tax=Myxocyprinus asiaticus TaxID=70543 RepID=UPI00222164A9|nr:cytoplasmic phosphatidylinositol transfer protein 1-like [Myxocyprinus asiaticus]